MCVYHFKQMAQKCEKSLEKRKTHRKINYRHTVKRMKKSMYNTTDH